MNFVIARRKLLDEVLIPSGIRDKRLLRAFSTIPRHCFVEEAFAMQAYGDNSLPIGHQQTISKPTIVAKMLQSAGLRYEDKVLEIGTGSGFQTALLSRLVRHVFSVEIIDDFLKRVRSLLAQLECYNVTLKKVDGHWGLPSEAPFDAIIVSAFFQKKIPAELFEQLSPEGGRMVAPMGEGRNQRLRLFVRNLDQIQESDLGSCVFVPMVRKKVVEKSL